jgi:4a-hydroxytetrahydrobiopterin dehydratase
MTSREKLPDDAIATFLSSNPGWERRGGALFRVFKFPDYGEALAFLVQVGVAAEKRDHHPEMLLGWGRVEVTWSTHDAGGITPLDIEMAERTDRLYGG